MKANSIIKATTLAFALVISGCANPPIIQISNDTYMLSKEDHAGIFGSMSKLKADVLIEANQFAESKGKVVLPISVREKPVGNKPADWATFELIFKLVDKDSREMGDSAFNANRKVMPIRPDVSIQRSDAISADISIKNQDRVKSDLYSDLVKLDDLRKRGIISESEFKTLKAKLLSNN